MEHRTLMARLLQGLYALTPDGCPELAEATAAAIDGGAHAIQYRDKHASGEARTARAARLLALCRRRRVPLIINDDLELVLALGADGVHLGCDDIAVAAARARFPDGLIGASCYNDLARAMDAVRSGASYVAFGSFHPSPTKPDAVAASPELLMQARRQLAVPVCAIGGIHAGNAAPLIRAGADALAVCNGVFAQSDITTAARAIADQFERHA